MHELTIIVAEYAIAVPVLAVVLTVWSLKALERKQFIVHCIIAVLVTFILTRIAAAIHSDPRPFVRDGITPYFRHATDNGFPSDHTAFSALIGWIIIFWRQRLGVTLVLLSLLIGTARVVAGVHHDQDIVGGFIIGLLGAAIAYGVLKVLCKPPKN